MFKHFWHDLTKSVEARRLQIKAFLYAAVAAATQATLDPEAMASWTPRRWAVFGFIILLAGLAGALKTGEMNPK